jgi:hypothetical protein
MHCDECIDHSYTSCVSIWALKWRRYRSVRNLAGHWVGSALLLGVLLRFFPLAIFLPRCARRFVGGLIRAEIRAEIIDQSVVISRIDDRAPLDHLVDFLRPGSFAEALLQDDARFVTLQTGSGGLGLHGTRRQILDSLRRRWLLGKRQGRRCGQDHSRQDGSREQSRQNSREISSGDLTSGYATWIFT